MSDTQPQATPEHAAVTAVHHPMPVEDFLRDHVLRRRPAVIHTGGLAELDWRTDRWNAQYLCERVGPVPVLVQVRRGGVFAPVRGAGAHTRMPFDEFVSRVLEDPDGDESLYLNIQGHDRQLGPPLLQLLGDFTLPVYFRTAPIRWINLWMGRTTEPAHSQLHHDYHDNLYCVVSGRKTFVIFPPADAPNLYTQGKPVKIEPNGVIHYGEEGQRGPGQPHFSMINTGRVDPGRFPRYARTRPQQVTVGPGDLLFLPAGWFHEVRSEGTHIALNFWADPPPSDRVTPDY